MGLAIGIPELLSMLTAELEEMPDERKKGNNTKYTVEEASCHKSLNFHVFFLSIDLFKSLLFEVQIREISSGLRSSNLEVN